MNPSVESTGSESPSQRMEQQLYDINARIGRLAMALGLSFDSPQAIQAALTTLAPPAVAVERRATADRRGGARGGSERRQGATRAELRGLLVLRYGAELRMVEQLGATSTRSVMQAVEQHLERQGFAPGQDGARFDGASDPA